MNVYITIILGCILIFASYKDIKYKEISNLFPLIIIVLAIIKMIIYKSCINNILGFFIVPAPMLFGMKKSGGIGAGDIKLMAALGLITGVFEGCISLTIGIILSILIIPVYRKLTKRNMKESFALVPFLSFGWFSVLLIKFLI